MSSRDSVFLNTNDRGLTALHREMGRVREEIESGFSEAVNRYREASDDASQIIANEIAYQAEQDRRVALEISSEINRTIDEARVYLGAQITELRWAIERNTQVTQEVLDSLWKTHWIDSRQFFDEGVQCYESGEREFARERFQKATEACRTNGFAYQYLGFLSVHDDDQAQSLRYFELATKFAPNDHHKAIAHYHLARAFHAAGNEVESLDHIRLAVELAPKDLVYQFELVRALMRTGSAQEAIRQLRKLISLDLRYWTAAAIDKSLDPMRVEITDLLSQMREEERVPARNLLSLFAQTIRVAESLPEISSFEIRSASKLKTSIESTFAKGTIFAYREVVGTVSATHEKFIETVVGPYKKRISASQQALADLAASNRARVDAIQAEIPRLIGQAEQVSNGLRQLEAQAKQESRSTDGGNGLALGCGGCLTVLGLFIFGGILMEADFIRRSTGHANSPDTLV
ncbi:MAG TPA: hypothetical protein VFC37_21600 [Terracidiphilus sp.]|nr:hypothetical protein [Terracidiphilus sp.]